MRGNKSKFLLLLRKDVNIILEINNNYNIDCLDGLKLLDDNSIDSIVTDPPYELGFMNKKWDNTGIAYNIDLWKEALRVLKPGGYLLAFGGTRTYHRMACAIEDAGFEIRDQIQWIYGSGFPKSMDISKAIDKKFGKYVKGEILPSSRKSGISQTGIATTFREKTASNPQTPEAQQWDGWGTALKPANEPIVVARKPLSEKTVAENVLKWGTGGINIDDCRIESSLDDKIIMDKKASKNPTTNYSDKIDKIYGKYALDKASPSNSIGRFPANVILDEEAGKLLNEQSGISKSTNKPRNNKQSVYAESEGRKYGKYNDCISYGFSDLGGASRFFYCAKASKKERGENNNHPTVKPLSLIKYLITLVTPPEGICLDPFEGSGTHIVACKELGFNYIGFEKDTTYCGIIENRIQDIVLDRQ